MVVQAPANLTKLGCNAPLLTIILNKDYPKIDKSIYYV